jgi:hypothetical protein
VLLSYHMHIYEDHRRAAPVREVPAFIAAEVERDRSLFFTPTAPPRRQPSRLDNDRPITEAQLYQLGLG